MTRIFMVVIVAVIILAIVNVSVDLSRSSSCDSWKDGIESVCGGTVVDAGGNATTANITNSNLITTANLTVTNNTTLDDTDINGIITGAWYTAGTLTGNQANWNLTGATSSLVRVATDGGNYNIYGISAGQVDGQMLFIANCGGGNITIHSQSGTATAANRIIFGAILDSTTETTVLYTYDATTERWRRIG